MASNKITRWRKTRKRRLTHAFVLRSIGYDSATGIFRWKVRPNVPKYINTRDAGNIAGTVNPVTGYRSLAIGGHFVYAHRLTWFYVYKKWPTRRLDHENTRKDENWIGNLREATRAQNAWNSKRPKTNTSGYKGVQFLDRPCKRHWIVRIKVNGVHHWVGCFYTCEEAVRARRAAAIRLHKRFVNHG